MERTLRFLIALVWLINGLFCKVANLVPRHQEIVAAILGNSHAFLLTKTIGVLEIMMALWIVSRIRTKSCAVFQIVIVMLMNCIEFFAVPELLLFGKANILFAVLFAIVIYYYAFVLHQDNRTC